MWILIRLFVFVVVLIARLGQSLFPGSRFGELDGKTFFARISRHKGRVTKYKVGIEFPLPLVFRFQEESRWDAFFKAIGYAKEFQTGDEYFDSSIYIASDHPAIFEHLQERDEARRLVLDTMHSGYHRIAADGRYLWLEAKNAGEPSESDMARVLILYEAFRDIGRRIRLRADRYNLRIAFVEAVTWSIGIYAFIKIAEVGFSRGDVHVDSFAFIVPGLILAAFMFALLFMGIRFLLGQSSRGHRIMVEGAVLLLLGLPITGMGLISELNRELDNSTPTVLTREIERRYWVKRRRKNTTYYEYYVRFADTPTVGATTLPQRMTVSKAVWDQLPQTGPVQLRVGQGRFGYAWYRGFVTE